VYQRVILNKDVEKGDVVFASDIVSYVKDSPMIGVGVSGPSSPDPGVPYVPPPVDAFTKVRGVIPPPAGPVATIGLYKAKADATKIACVCHVNPPHDHPDPQLRRRGDVRYHLHTSGKMITVPHDEFVGKWTAYTLLAGK
jgi:hypothetical protein